FNVAAHRLHHFGRPIAPDCSRSAAQAGAITRLLRLVGFAEKRDIVATGTPGGAGWPAIHAGRGHSKDELSILVDVAGQHCLPLVFVLALVNRGHLRRFCQVEYRIACHNEESLCRVPNMGHPDLAVKTRFLSYACACGLRTVVSSHFYFSVLRHLMS